MSEAGNVEILKSPVRRLDDSRDWCLRTAVKQASVVEAISRLPNPRCDLYLLQCSGNASRMNYLTRATPKQLFAPALTHFDFTVLDASYRWLDSGDPPSRRC